MTNTLNILKTAYFLVLIRSRRSGGSIHWAKGENLIYFPTPHVYFFGGGGQIPKPKCMGALAGYVPWIRLCQGVSDSHQPRP